MSWNVYYKVIHILNYKTVILNMIKLSVPTSFYFGSLDIVYFDLLCKTLNESNFLIQL